MRKRLKSKRRSCPLCKPNKTGHAFLSLLEAKSGKVKRYSSVDEIFKKLKI